MRKVICLISTLLICASLALPALAAGTTFVPSISYKDGPTIEDATLDGENVSGCVVVTSILEAKDKTTDITQEERDTLLEVYEKLSDGSMKLPGLPDDYVIRDLVDVSFEYNDCRVIEEHGHKDQVLKGDATLTVDFDLGIGKNTEVVVMIYVDGEWQIVKDVTNNGDGTITCVFDDICPVVFAVKQSDIKEGLMPKTGDVFGQNLTLWIGVMAVSAVVLIAVVIVYRKKSK